METVFGAIIGGLLLTLFWPIYISKAIADAHEMLTMDIMAGPTLVFQAVWVFLLIKILAANTD